MKAKFITSRLIKIKDRSWTYFKDQSQSGQIALIVVLALLSTSTVMAIGLGILTFNEVKKLNNVVKTAQSYYAAEGGAEDAIIRVKNRMNYPGSYPLAVGGSTATVTITGTLEDLSIISEGNTVGRVRKVAINLTAEPSTESVDFNYGVQVDAGGVVMKSNSNILGNIYSNGPITGASNSFVKGDAFSAVTGGAVGIDKMTIQESAPGVGDGNAHANRITQSTIDGTAYCQTGSGNNKPCDTSQPDPTPQPLPISNSTINTWKDWADDGGEVGSQTISGTANLGPIKINGNLTVNSNASLTITGTVWVTGDIHISSNSLILLQPSYGANGSSTVIADGQIKIDSNITICGSNGGVLGSCNPENGSYIMFLSTFPFDPTEDAIVADSNILTSILYANNGAIRLNSNVHVKEVTGYGLRLESNATVTYETGLASVQFTSGPGGAFKIHSWQEIE